MSRANTWSSNSVSNQSAQFNRGSFSQGTTNVRPSGSQIQQFRNQGGQERNIGTNASRENMQQFFQQHPNATGLQNSGGSLNLPTNRNALNQTMAGNGNVANQLRNNISQQYPNSKNWFGNQFWNNRGNTPNYWNAGQNWGGYYGWGAVDGWLPYQWGSPLYYDDGVPVDVSQESIYQYNLGSGPSPDQGYEANQQNYASPPPTAEPPQNSDWLPLGNYALTSSNEGSDANMFFQLALGKDGSITGSYYNQTTDKVYPIEGMVDQDSQKAAWRISEGQNSPVFITGLYNLTLPQTTIQVYFGNDVQNWLMVRM
jgi:hypothetical protein